MIGVTGTEVIVTEETVIGWIAVTESMIAIENAAGHVLLAIEVPDPLVVNMS